MKQICLAIMDYDKGYSYALAKAIALTSNEFEVHLYPEKSGLDDFDLILINEKDLNSLTEAFRQKAVILSETKNNTPWSEAESEGHFLYKYDCISILTASLRLSYAKIYGCINPFLSFEKQPFVVGLFSGSGGVGTTAVSIALARELADKKQNKVLFLSLEELESSSVYFKFPQTHPFMGDYLYYLFSGGKKQNVATFYSSFQFQDSYGVELFYPSISDNELCILSLEEIHIFIDSISKIGDYDYIVLDVGSHLSKEVAYWLEHCNQCVLLGNGSLLSLEKNKKRLERLQKQYRFDKNSLLEWCVSRDEEAFQEVDNRIEIRCNYEFGLEVRALADTIKHADAKQRNRKRNYGCSSLRYQCEDGTDHGWGSLIPD